jgi:hypothetical protein
LARHSDLFGNVLVTSTPSGEWVPAPRVRL